MRPTIADQIWSWVLPKRTPYWQNPLRWSGEENDYAFGPFMYSSSDYRPWAVIFTSWGSGEDDDKPANLRISCPWWGTLIMRLPRWMVPGPTITRVYPEQAEWKAPDGEVFKRLGRDYYENIDAHEYGFTMSRSGTVGDSVHLQVRKGRSTLDSSTDQSWGCFLPWTCWRHVRHSYYDLQGKLFETVPERGTYYKGSILGAGMGYYDAMREIEETVPKVVFGFHDYDGELLTATTFIEEREWRHGKGWFKWLSWFSKPIIHRSLSINFSGETGKKKGSWKGGTTGHSIEMDRGPDGQFYEGHLGAFLRYCSEHEMTFVSVGPPPGWNDEATPRE